MCADPRDGGGDRTGVGQVSEEKVNNAFQIGQPGGNIQYESGTGENIPRNGGSTLRQCTNMINNIPQKNRRGK